MLIHREDALVVDSWMLGLKHDLCWLSNNDKSLPALQTMHPPASPTDLDLTVFFDLWAIGVKILESLRAEGLEKVSPAGRYDVQCSRYA